jgi:hypothetical protein
MPKSRQALLPLLIFCLGLPPQLAAQAPSSGGLPKLPQTPALTLVVQLLLQQAERAKSDKE